LDAAIRDGVAPGLSLLPAGYPASNASELLGGQRLARLIATVRSAYDMIIIDSPPVLAVSDPSVLCRLSEGTLLVARADLSDVKSLRDAVEQLRRVGAPVTGLVVNEVPRKGGYRRYGYYEYGEYHGKRRSRSRGKGSSPALLPAPTSDDADPAPRERDGQPSTDQPLT
ncbi:MAG: hypothetical protein P8177_13255, partial [Gemmatimonadota bacterium]